MELANLMDLTNRNVAFIGMPILQGGHADTTKPQDGDVNNNKHFEPVLVCCGFFLTVR